MIDVRVGAAASNLVSIIDCTLCNSSVQSHVQQELVRLSENMNQEGALDASNSAVTVSAQTEWLQAQQQEMAAEKAVMQIFTRSSPVWRFVRNDLTVTAVQRLLKDKSNAQLQQMKCRTRMKQFDEIEGAVAPLSTRAALLFSVQRQLSKFDSLHNFMTLLRSVVLRCFESGACSSNNMDSLHQRHEKGKMLRPSLGETGRSFSQRKLSSPHLERLSGRRTKSRSTNARGSTEFFSNDKRKSSNLHVPIFRRNSIRHVACVRKAVTELTQTVMRYMLAGTERRHHLFPKLLLASAVERESGAVTHAEWLLFTRGQVDNWALNSLSHSFYYILYACRQTSLQMLLHGAN
jgi:hypothetical protein